MNRANIERLILVMKENKIKYSKEFNNILEHGFTDEARESFFKETAQDLEDVLRHGVNSGFNKTMKETAHALVELCVKAGEEGHRAPSLDRLRFEKKNFLATIKMTKEYKPEYALCDNVKEYAETAKVGMDVLKSSQDAQTSVEAGNMKACRKLLDNIIAAVDDVFDISSERAAEKYNAVITKLRTWRMKLAKSGGLYDSASVALLEDVLRIIKDWATLSEATVIRHAKIQDVYGIPEDDLTQAIQSVSIRQNIDMFLARCDAYANETKDMRNNGVIDKIMAERAKLRDIEKDEMEIVKKFKAGELYREDAEYELQRLKEQKDYIQFSIGRLESDKVSFEKIAMRREMISKIEKPIRTSFNYVKDNRLHIYTLFSGMDFSRLIGMLNNNVSTQEFAIGIQEMQKVLIARGIVDEQGRVLMDNIKQQLDLVDEMNAQNRMASGLDSLTTESESTSLLDALLAKDAGSDEPSKNDKNLLDIM